MCSLRQPGRPDLAAWARVDVGRLARATDLGDDLAGAAARAVDLVVFAVARLIHGRRTDFRLDKLHLTAGTDLQVKTPAGIARIAQFGHHRIGVRRSLNTPTGCTRTHRLRFATARAAGGPGKIWVDHFWFDELARAGRRARAVDSADAIAARLRRIRLKLGRDDHAGCAVASDFLVLTAARRAGGGKDGAVHIAPRRTRRHQTRRVRWQSRSAWSENGFAKLIIAGT